MLSLIGLCVGLVLGFVWLFVIPNFGSVATDYLTMFPQKGQVIGFLPAALLSRASTDYSRDLTTLAYFGLTLDTDGTILKLTNPQEEDPGWYALDSGKVTPFLTAAKQKNVALSLVIFSGNNQVIDEVMADPVTHAKNLTQDVIPIMKQYGFTDLNLDIESTKEASTDGQMRFVQFIRTVKSELMNAQAGTLTIDISTLDVIRKDLIDPQKVAQVADILVLMAYDYHSTASFVTGPVAPLDGAGIDAEYDVTSAVDEALKEIPHDKLILGVPLYGYDWETINNSPRSAVIPGTGEALSNQRAEDTLANCATCSAQFDQSAQELHSIIKDPVTGAYEQLFYPDKQSMTAKIGLAQKNHLAGLALWALGYEGDTILTPLESYHE